MHPGQSVERTSVERTCPFLSVERTCPFLCRLSPFFVAFLYRHPELWPNRKTRAGSPHRVTSILPCLIWRPGREGDPGDVLYSGSAN